MPKRQKNIKFFRRETRGRKGYTMSKLNFAFMNVNAEIMVNDINRIIFVGALENLNLSAEIREENKVFDELYKQFDNETDDDARAELTEKIDAQEGVIERLKYRRKAVQATSDLQLFGVHKKGVNVDGIADKLGISEVYFKYTDYRSGIVSREKYIQAWASCLKGMGMKAPDELFRKSAVKIADAVGDVATGNRQVVKGELYTPTKMKGWLVIVMRVLTQEMRNNARIVRYTAETHTAQVTYNDDNTVNGMAVLDK